MLFTTISYYQQKHSEPSKMLFVFIILSGLILATQAEDSFANVTAAGKSWAKYKKKSVVIC